jgi:transposase
MPRHRLRDAVWASLHAKLVTIPGIWRTDAAALRRFVEAVAYVLRTGIAWEDLPATFGETGTAYRRFRRWACKGIWDELFLEGVPTDALETVMLDSSACKAQRFASGARSGGEEALGRSRGGVTTRIHAAVDALGRPLCFLLTPGQAADCRQARPLLEGLSFERLIGDRGYDTDELRDWAEELGAEAVIPSKRNRKVPIPHDRAAYKTRHRVENLFCRIKDFGRIVLRKCKTSRSYAGLVSLAFALVNIQLCQ